MATTKPLILVTGADQGIDCVATKQLAGTGKSHILIGARSQKKAEGGTIVRE